MKESGVEADVTAAFDINSVANECYEHNFPHLKVTRVNIEHLPVEYFDKLSVDGWLMSPPCQPYTRGGKLLDAEDPRARGFLYLTSVLGQMTKPPSYVFIENVLNFEVSQCHKAFMQVLSLRGYQVHEFLVCPSDPFVGIPNDRLRYYLIAYKAEEAKVSGHIFKSFAEFFNTCPRIKEDLRVETRELSNIGNYLRGSENDNAKYAVPMKYLTDYINYRHDIVNAESTRSTTFTKAYGSKHIIGTGSFLQTKRLDQVYEPDDREVLPTLGLRFFSPFEIGLLHAFPMEDGQFKFPAKINDAQRYRLLGNSLNVRVVALLFRILFNLGDSI